jgi:DNA-binding response OmpR family regulator
MKILFIEDNLEFQEHVIRVFLAEHEVASAYDGGSGIELFENMSFDLIILDYQMDQIHGPEVMQHIRGNFSDIPVIAMSMEDRLNDRLLALGADVALPKRAIENLPGVIRELCG